MALTSLAAAFPESVFLPSDPEYTARVSSYFSAFARESKPLCIIQPRTTQELASVIKQLAADSSSKVAILGGGYTPYVGFSSIESGIVLDLKNFKGIRIDKEKATVTVGAAERWGDVYEALEKEGLGVVGGRHSKVGVSGLTLGGGLSYHSREHGFVCDSVCNFAVVLSSGELISANSKENHDLFAALKGGSSNFGMVISFTFPTFPQGQMWGGSIFLPPTAYPQTVDLFCEFVTSQEKGDKRGSVIFSYAHSPQGKAVALNLHATSPEAPPSLKKMVELQPQYLNTIREDSLRKFVIEQGSFSKEGSRFLQFTTTVKLDRDYLLRSGTTFMDMAAKKSEHVQDCSITLCLQPLPVDLLRASAQRGPNALGLRPEDGPLVNILIVATYSSANDDEKVVELAQAIIGELEQLARQTDVAHRYRFLNYAYKGEKVTEGLGEETIKNLREVSQKYDPIGFFQRNVTGGNRLGL